MATYVLSDIHGHPAPLERLLSRLSLRDGRDQLVILGDMVDRGPDPLSVLRICKSLPNTLVLLGNHEEMMLDCLVGTDSDEAWLNWYMNGGQITANSLAPLAGPELEELVGWVANLPLYARAKTEKREYLLVHAGLRMPLEPHEGPWTDEDIDELLKSQSVEDLLWIREDFWGRPTGLLDENGEGPVVVAGHTPTMYVFEIADSASRPATDNGLSVMLELGAGTNPSGVADRLAIDCGAGSVPGSGRLCMLRLDDGEVFYENLGFGE